MRIYHNLETILERCITAKVLISAIERRATGKPGHQDATPEELLANVQRTLDDIAKLLKRGATS